MRWPWTAKAVPRPIQYTPASNDAALCRFCGGLHTYYCPRIARARLFPPDEDGHQDVCEVEFDARFADVLWDDVRWPLPPEGP